MVSLVDNLAIAADASVGAESWRDGRRGVLLGYAWSGHEAPLSSGTKTSTLVETSGRRNRRQEVSARRCRHSGLLLPAVSAGCSGVAMASATPDALTHGAIRDLVTSARSITELMCGLVRTRVLLGRSIAPSIASRCSSRCGGRAVVYGQGWPST